MSCMTPNWRRGRPEFVPGDVALAVNDSQDAVRADHPIFDVVARTAAQRSRSGLGCSRTVFRVDQFEPAVVPLWQVDRLDAKNSAGLVRQRHVIGGKVPLPPADTCNPLRLFQPGFIPAEIILRPLPLRQVEHESNAFVPLSSKEAAPTSTSTRLPSLRKYSFSYGCARSGPL